VGFSCKFVCKSFNLFKIDNFIRIRTLCDGLYKFKLDNVFVKILMTLHYNVGTKQDLVDGTYAYL